MACNTQAVELNDAIRSTNPYVLDMLSEKGLNIFFPKKGILAQTAESKNLKINATIGISLEDDGEPMVLDSLNTMLSVEKGSFSYAPSYGNPDIRALWKEMLFKKNPSLSNRAISLPVVTSALTHGLSMAGYILINPGDTIITPDLYWENYDLIFKHTYGAQFSTFPTFIDNKSFNIKGMEEQLNAGPAGKKIVVLNFPNNPTGYTVTETEAQEIKDVLIRSAQKGNTITVLIDDAYFGLVYEDGIIPESMFSVLADAHERILAVKFDGPTKEDYVWGFRVGFVTFGVAKNSEQLYRALESKMAGAIRATISSASNLSQYLLYNAYRTPDYSEQKREKFNILKRRYQKIRSIFHNHPEYSEYIEPLPNNSGYFMCLKMKNEKAEATRRTLMEKYGTGVISQKGLLRVAFSSIPYDSLDQLFENIYRAARETV
ncbi:aminotransferase class I/II-fold pyridoxal phosphate-dependent enzyme [Chitinispirillales bacterium ANBcel5]|uniref:aminotransferase class I/II-fold pyridoxal phosphate-dependent enzyme n=1 Tax=Cellulosispirillum alkaliphilum TaxID=3039283 RepID=UPI002A571B26|nr:aminotransferase class I/II-fold pyridoxal phosphate-dependent enzyme [Chitinispirillales bacterium ANBcel5]